MHFGDEQKRFLDAILAIIQADFARARYVQVEIDYFAWRREPRRGPIVLTLFRADSQIYVTFSGTAAAASSTAYPFDDGSIPKIAGAMLAWFSAPVAS